ncbi:MAG: hypothetical protein OK456_07525 [Thaumarchaeota archaeon]|nr:hypothetical protein [Nitrososphaerota archaeon]
MTVFSDILRAHGITAKSFIAYGEPSLTGAGFSALQDGAELYAQMGFLIYPYQDMSDGYSSAINDIYAAFSSLGGGVIGGVTGWGYTTGMQFDCAAKYPDEQEYYLIAGALVKATSYGIPGIVQESPLYLAEWVKQYAAMDAGLGLDKVLGISGWPASDHGVNYAGAQGANGGHNMKTYTRYVNSPLTDSTGLGFYSRDVSSDGAHVGDGTPCLLWGLREQSDTAFTGQTTVTVTGAGSSATYSGGIIPTVAMANDVTTYHRASSFVNYYATAGDATIELTLLQMVQAKGLGAMARTAIPLDIVANLPAYYGSPVVDIGTDPSNAYAVMQSRGGGIAGVPYFNWANGSDNSSNPGQSEQVGIATSETVLNFFLNGVPYLSNLDFFDVDTEIEELEAQAAATSWPHFSSLWKQIPVGGWFGNEQNVLHVLTIDHYSSVPQTWSALGLICRQWATDSYASLSGWDLSQFQVLLGLPAYGQDLTYAQDMAQLRDAVNAGTNLILWSYPSEATDLTGQGTTAIPIPYGHPITQPYAEDDLNTGMPNGYGTINQYGAGKVIVLPENRYGDGFGANGQGSSDSLASGLAWLTMNAILWAGGQPTPAMWLPKYVQRTSWANPNMGPNDQGQYSGVGIHLIGPKNGGKTLLLSNSQTVAQQVAFDLDAAFFGFPWNYVLRDANTGQVISGTSSPVSINVTIPALDWMVFVQQSVPITTSVQLSARAH